MGSWPFCQFSAKFEFRFLLRREAHESLVFRPEGPVLTAQGNALGTRRTHEPALKGPFKVQPCKDRVGPVELSSDRPRMNPTCGRFNGNRFRLHCDNMRSLGRCT